MQAVVIVVAVVLAVGLLAVAIRTALRAGRDAGALPPDAPPVDPAGGVLGALPVAPNASAAPSRLGSVRPPALMDPPAGPVPSVRPPPAVAPDLAAGAGAAGTHVARVGATGRWKAVGSAPAADPVPMLYTPDLAPDDEPVTALTSRLSKASVAAMVRAIDAADAPQPVAPVEVAHMGEGERYEVRGGAATDAGRRERNDDSHLCRAEKHLFAVADGMARAGAIASELVVESLYETTWDDAVEGEGYGEQLTKAIQRANEAIYARARAEGAPGAYGTTVVAMYVPFEERAVYIAHVGNSRCYRLRGGDLARLTTDHTLGSYGETGPAADKLTRAVGGAPELLVDVTIDVPRSGDVYLLCTDGLWKTLRESVMADVLVDETSPDAAARALVTAALRAGARDNVTALVVRLA